MLENENIFYEIYVWKGKLLINNAVKIANQQENDKELECVKILDFILTLFCKVNKFLNAP